MKIHGEAWKLFHWFPTKRAHWLTRHILVSFDWLAYLRYTMRIFLKGCISQFFIILNTSDYESKILIKIAEKYLPHLWFYIKYNLEGKLKPIFVSKRRVKCNDTKNSGINFWRDIHLWSNASGSISTFCNAFLLQIWQTRATYIEHAGSAASRTSFALFLISEF